MLAPNARHWGNDDSRPGDDDDSHGDGHWYLFGSHIVGFLVSATGYRLSHFIYMCLRRIPKSVLSLGSYPYLQREDRAAQAGFAKAQPSRFCIL